MLDKILKTWEKPRIDQVPLLGTTPSLTRLLSKAAFILCFGSIQYDPTNRNPMRGEDLDKLLESGFLDAKKQ